MITDLKLNFNSARVFLPSILIVSIILLIVSSFIFQLSSSQIIFFGSLLLLTDIAILYLLGQKRRSELDSVKKIINQIRTNSFKSADEIQMGNSLHELEDEIKRMFLKTNNDIAHLKKLEQFRTEFLGNVSHELRTPIFAIQGYIETLLDGALDDEKVNKVFLQKANNHTLNLNNLVNDLIDISMIESGKMQMSFRYFNAHEFFDGIILELKPHAIKKNLELNLSSFDQALQLFGDRQRLRQVMTNLIMNAIKYTESGSVDVGVIQIEKYGKVFIRDTGIGIAETDINRIFERFYRVDRDRSRQMGGTGLGLAIVKHIVEAHGSKIEVNSELGKGTEFYFSLKI
jgi:two-component system phosphate regulon sensor histidine kinase PhoR